MSARYCLLMMLLVDGVVLCCFFIQFFYQLLRITVEIFNYNCGLSIFSLLLDFASHVLQLCCLVLTHLECYVLVDQPFPYCIISFSVFGDFLCSEIYYAVAAQMASVVSTSVRPYELQPTRFLGPWDSSGKNTGRGSHALLQGIFPTQELNLGLLNCRQILYH